MNEQDKELLERYLTDIRKRNKKIAFSIIFIFFIISIIFYLGYARYNQEMNKIDNFTQIETNIINTNNTNDKGNEINTNVISDEDTKEENQLNGLSKENENVVTKEENISQKTNEEHKQNTSEMKVQNGEKSKDTNENPSNKDFLFTNGYTMDNVTQAAQDYLKSYNYSGECVPIKDSEGVYLGMRVIFY